MIIVESHRKSLETIRKNYPEAIIHDVTSHAKDEFIRFSPFYPVRGVPVPFTPGMTGSCVEAIWQGLKVFESQGCDISLFTNTTMKDLKRTKRRFGKTLGHKKGVFGKELLDYIPARKLIYLPTYKWVLENRLQKLVEKLKEESAGHTVVLLDYETNSNVEDRTKPLSHASLIKAYVEGKYPEFCDCESPVSTDSQATDYEPVEIGELVIHPKFGTGTVLELNGDRVTVKFENGTKVLSQRFARLHAAIMTL